MGSVTVLKVNTADVKASNGGALKPNDVDPLWVHVMCAWFQPEISFLSEETMEPTVGISRILSNSFIKDIAELGHQFQSGIKTIVVIPMSSQSVVQFGFHQKISERLDFVNHIKSLFQQPSSFPEPCISRSSHAK